MFSIVIFSLIYLSCQVTVKKHNCLLLFGKRVQGKALLSEQAPSQVKRGVQASESGPFSARGSGSWRLERGMGRDGEAEW